MKSVVLSLLAAALAAVLLLFWPAGDPLWAPGWRFLAAATAGWTISAAILKWRNPGVFEVRSGLHPGTPAWDRALLAAILPSMAAVLPTAALDAGRFGWSNAPSWTQSAGYALFATAIAAQTWAQAVNPFFEQGARIQSERDQRVVDRGPYALVRHPGYASAPALLAGTSLALHSLWGLLPALVATILLAVRTKAEDDLLISGLPGYRDYARRVRFRLMPGAW